MLSVIWSYVMVGAIVWGSLRAIGFDPVPALPGFDLIPEWWGLVLALTYLLQAAVSQIVERRYEPDMLRSLFWIVWYPLAFWMLSTLSTVVGLPRALLRPRQVRTTWTSPDRGLR
jgi:biofilm PGA synthesis N-glycosyltransferase PgaC